MNPLRSVAMIVSFLALAGIVGPGLWYLLSDSEAQQLETVKRIMAIATLVWFVTAPVWMQSKSEQSEGQNEPSEREEPVA